VTRLYSHDRHAARAIAGHFEFDRELRLSHDGRDVLVLLGMALVDTACCGTTGMRYAVVPGYVVDWHGGTDDQGHCTSEVELVLDQSQQRAIGRVIRASHTVTQVVFW
jgi:hypothetical protein